MSFKPIPKTNMNFNSAVSKNTSQTKNTKETNNIKFNSLNINALKKQNTFFVKKKIYPRKISNNLRTETEDKKIEEQAKTLQPNKQERQKRLVVQRTPVYWNKKQIINANSFKSKIRSFQNVTSYGLLVDENFNSENNLIDFNNNYIKKIKNFSLLKNENSQNLTLIHQKTGIISSILSNNNNYFKEENRKRDMSVSNKSEYFNLKFTNQGEDKSAPKDKNNCLKNGFATANINSLLGHNNLTSTNCCIHNNENEKKSKTIKKESNSNHKKCNAQQIKTHSTEDTVNNLNILNNLSNFKVSSNNNKNNDNSEFFEYEKEKNIELNSEEKALYGDRVPKNYKKIKILGKGGNSIVWLIQDASGKEFAGKQVYKKPKSGEFFIGNAINISHCSQMAKKEIEIMNFIKESLKPDEKDDKIGSLITFYDYYEDNNDIWIIFEKGGKNLSDLCVKIKGEFIGYERIYTIKKGHFLQKLMSDLSQFKLLIKKMLIFIDILSKRKIIHSDIKPDNILINYNEDTYEIKNIKLIDFGSSYFLDNPVNFSSNTPEYMSPEITNLLEKHSSPKEVITFLKKLTNCPWCIDMWSLGVTLLEVVLGVPLWMSYKVKITIRNKNIFKTGLFGVKGRDGNKIYQKQFEIVKNLKKILKDCLIDDIMQRRLFLDLLSKMLEIDYNKRISPLDALNHDFFKDENNVHEN